LHVRAQKFSEAFYQSVGEDVDIICMQELIFGRREILKSLTQHVYTTPVMRASLWSGNIKLLQSGLCIASKYPISKIHASLFDGPTYHVERICAKGILYAQIQVPNVGNVHIVNIHLNAWSGAKATEARQHQIQQAAKFIHTLDIPENEPLFWAGDWNIDMYEHSDEMDDLMTVLGAEMLRPDTTQFSFDPLTNPLVGLDDPSEYRTMSKQGGCEKTFLMEGICDCCPRQLVDGFGVSKHHLKPISVNIKIHSVETFVPFEMDIHLGVRRLVKNVTDHNAVKLRVTFPPKLAEEHCSGSLHCHKIEYDESRYDWTWIIAHLVLTGCFFVLLLLFFRMLRKMN